MWKSTYNITFFQAYLLMTLGAFVGVIFSSCLSMLISIISRSTTVAVIVPSIMLCAFPFIGRIIVFKHVYSFLPSQLLEIYITLKEFNLTEISGNVFSTEMLIIPMYAVLVFLLIPIMYGLYRKADVR